MNHVLPACCFQHSHISVCMVSCMEDTCISLYQVVVVLHSDPTANATFTHMCHMVTTCISQPYFSASNELHYHK